MKKFITQISYILFSSIIFISIAANAQEFKIASGKITGLYYRVANDVCKIFNKHYRHTLAKCSVVITENITENISLLLSGKVDMALIDSNLQQRIINNQHPSLKNFSNDIRSVFVLYPEHYTFVVRKNSNITNISHIKNKIINIGKQNSATQNAFTNISKIYGWTDNMFKRLKHYNNFEQGQALCDHRIDVAIYVIGHPNGFISETLDQCNLKILNLQDKVIAKFLLNNKAFGQTYINAEAYNYQINQAKTIAVYAELVSAAKTNEKLVYKLIQTIFDNLPELKKSITEINNVNHAKMCNKSNILPLHKGAKRYYQEICLNNRNF